MNFHFLKRLLGLGVAATLLLHLPLIAQQYQWSWALQDSVTSQVSDIACGSNGSVVAVGDFFSVPDMDPGSGTTALTATANKDAFILKMNANHELEWVRQIAGSSQDLIFGLTVDAQDNVYYDGLCSGMADLDPGPGTIPFDAGVGDNAFLVKLDATGILQWAAILKGVAGAGKIYGHATDSNGDVVIFGQFAGTADFAPGPATQYFSTPSVAPQSFIWKISAQGQLLWVKQFDYGFVGGLPSIALDSQGNILLSGHFADTVDFDLGSNVVQLMAQTGNDAFVAKYDPMGDFIWAKAIGNLNHVTTLGLHIGTGDVAYCLVRNNTAPLDLDPGTGTFQINSAGKPALVKLDPAGNFVAGLETDWRVTHQSNNFWEVVGEQVYVANSFNTMIDMDPGAGSVQFAPGGVQDGYVVKLGAAMDYRWAAQFEAIGQGQALPRCLAVNPAGSVILGGQYLTSVDLDPSAVSLVYTHTGFDGMLVQLSDSDFVVHLPEASEAPAPLLFPNPSQGQLAIDLGAQADGIATIYDSQGRLMGKWEVASRQPIQLDLADGFYQVVIQTEDRHDACKLRIIH